MSAALGSDRRGLEILDLDTCLARLAAQPVGRVAMMERGEMVILPVNHVVAGMTIGFRTAVGTKLAQAVDGKAVGLEVDAFDQRSRTGWSVLVQGNVRIATAEEAQRLESAADPPWVSGAHTWVVIDPIEIAGRELPPTKAVAVD
jgi:nitroimidazol reductase NimA-like FMN-containing flavoprotein (pyridoxamine 5'-phosphate oxidase superfamily)